MDSSRDRDFLFEILLDDDAKGLTLIQGAPIHSCEDLRRARAEIARAGHPHHDAAVARKHPN